MKRLRAFKVFLILAAKLTVIAMLCPQFAKPFSRPQQSMDYAAFALSYPYQETETAGCEQALSALDKALLAAAESQDSKSVIIIISRLGQKEKSAKLHQSRLDFVKKHLQRQKEISFVNAIGERAENLGALEIYVTGKLFWVLRLKKNQPHFCADSYGL